jgi:hypothetical protein
MVRGILGGEIPPAVRILTARETSSETRQLAAHFFRRLGAETVTEHDPDLPMLLKNMNAARL